MDFSTPSKLSEASKPQTQKVNQFKAKREISEKQKASAEEYMTARTLHDRFCKFEAPYHAPTAIKTLRGIKDIVPAEVLKDATLGFKLNNLRWFLTPDGKKFLHKQHKRWQLDKKLQELKFDEQNQLKQLGIPSSELKQIATSGAKEYTSNEKQTILDFLT